MNQEVLGPRRCVFCSLLFRNKRYLLHFLYEIPQGRPKGVTPKYSLAPLVPRLSELIGVEVLAVLKRKANRARKIY